MRDAGGAQHRRHAQRPQHHRGVAVGAAFLGRDPGQPRRIEQRRVGRAQRFADQHGAFGQAGKAVERRAGQVAHQAAGDLADLVGAALQAGAVLGRHAGFRLGQDGVGDRLGFLDHGAFRRQQGFLDPPPHAADQPRRAEHADIGVDQRRDLGLAFLRQDRQPGAQLAELLARLGDGGLQPGALAGDVGGLDLVAGDLRHRFGGAEDRSDGDAGRDGDAGETRSGRAGPHGGGTRQALVLRCRRLSRIHRSPPRPGRPARPAPPAHPSPGRAARSSRPGRRPASSAP